MINIYDFDGVVTEGHYPSIGDIIVTGRSFEREDFDIVCDFMLNAVGYLVPIFFNPIQIKTRGTGTKDSQVISGQHKVNTLQNLIYSGVVVNNIYEDNLIQYNMLSNYISTLSKDVPVLHLITGANTHD